MLNMMTLVVVQVICHRISIVSSVIVELDQRILQNEDFCKTRIFANRRFLQIEDFCKTRIFAKRGLLQNEDFCKSRISAKRGFLQNEDFCKSRISSYRRFPQIGKLKPKQIVASLLILFSLIGNQLTRICHLYYTCCLLLM